MVKWESPIFTELQNKLGEQVVFSNWNGQQYFREYVHEHERFQPVQEAYRDKMRQATSMFDGLDEWFDAGPYWEGRAEGTDLSGFSLFMKRMMESEIKITPNDETFSTLYEWSHPFDGEQVDIAEIQWVENVNAWECYLMVENVDKTGSLVFPYSPSSNAHQVLIIREDEYITNPERGISTFAFFSIDAEEGRAVPAIPGGEKEAGTKYLF